MSSFSLVTEALTGLIYHRLSGENPTFSSVQFVFPLYFPRCSIISRELYFANSKMAADKVTNFDPNDHQHSRYNPLRDEWILVSPHRMKRPWKGKVEKKYKENTPRYDPNNPLCPGATRSNGMVRSDSDSREMNENEDNTKTRLNCGQCG